MEVGKIGTKAWLNQNIWINLEIWRFIPYD